MIAGGDGSRMMRRGSSRGELPHRKRAAVGSTPTLGSELAQNPTVLGDRDVAQGVARRMTGASGQRDYGRLGLFPSTEGPQDGFPPSHPVPVF